MTSALPTTPRRTGGPTTPFVTVLCLAGIVVALQQTLVIPLVPQLPTLLGTSLADTSWAVTATLLAGAVATPTVGRLADMFGKRRLLLICLAVLVAGSVIAALSTNLPMLVVGRALQGLATGVIPLGISLMNDHLPADRIPAATAQMSASLGVGGALGLPLAAVIAGNMDWHAVFWIAAALAAVSTLLVFKAVPESPRRTGGRFDLPGALGLSAALISFLLALSKGGEWGWGSPATLVLFGAAAVLTVTWGVHELRTAEPLVDLRTTRKPQVLLTNLVAVAFGYAMLISSYAFPQLLQLPAETGYGLGQTILVAGLVMAPGGLCIFVMSPISARITTTAGPRTTLIVGAIVTAAGYGFAAAFHGQIWHLLISMIFVSSGVGLAFGAMPSLIMSAVPSDQTASANSFNNLARAIGSSVASAVSGVLLAQITMSVDGTTYPAESAFSTVLTLGVAAALAALVLAALIPVTRSSGKSADASGSRAHGRQSAATAPRS